MITVDKISSNETNAKATYTSICCNWFSETAQFCFNFCYAFTYKGLYARNPWFDNRFQMLQKVTNCNSNLSFNHIHISIKNSICNQQHANIEPGKMSHFRKNFSQILGTHPVCKMPVLRSIWKIISFSTSSSNHIYALVDISLTSVHYTNPGILKTVCFPFQYLPEAPNMIKNLKCKLISHSCKIVFEKMQKIRAHKHKKCSICSYVQENTEHCKNSKRLEVHKKGIK